MEPVFRVTFANGDVREFAPPTEYSVEGGALSIGTPGEGVIWHSPIAWLSVENVS